MKSVAAFQTRWTTLLTQVEDTYIREQYQRISGYAIQPHALNHKFQAHNWHIAQAGIEDRFAQWKSIEEQLDALEVLEEFRSAGELPESEWKAKMEALEMALEQEALFWGADPSQGMRPCFIEASEFEYEAGHDVAYFLSKQIGFMDVPHWQSQVTGKGFSTIDSWSMNRSFSNLPLTSESL